MAVSTRLREIDHFTWEIPMDAQAGMRVPGIIFADRQLLERAENDRALQQVMNVAHLPGIVKASFAMPDIHWGYGFPIGGVAATDLERGVVSPGGVGFDISCGVRLLKTSLVLADVHDRLDALMDEINRLIPKGLGAKGGRIILSRREMEGLLEKGTRELIARGIGWEEDLEVMEEEGSYPGADPSKVSDRAFERGKGQVGSLGSGNHFVEIQEVDEVYGSADQLGLFQGQVVIMIHSGSRGLGHQVCTDYLVVMGKSIARSGYELPDRQLAFAGNQSEEGRDYIAAMACGANFAMANREAMTHWVRDAFEKVFRSGARSLGMELLYDVSHNLAKPEEHQVNGNTVGLMVHRKGATRSFPGRRPEVPKRYAEAGQPVIIPGSMGSNSYVLVGTEEALAKSFGSTCHGAGRAMSRKAAKKQVRGAELVERMREKGILVRSGSISGLVEEAPEAYKDIHEIVEVCEGAGLSRKVARMRPLGVLKG
ncbi:MAG: RNA-splicing ligase RtcB [Actinobacteria bacterium RBG_19FT_COMBO_54_7]|uniref:tRNA-splicing ligase RtcB n=1 Tax=Candidatus Solincola sediminis TaxID=1797199 RepID=A0A1F2WR48_9ACTN|nr:MAG: RNA-splicing ligase RtcB [Candidatus Solincola sediminis]OFW70230.1 MAG: RNA-splicing ligase RtcB [Actinobacteria bacterium RBG_19FT_COMBO_54_7]